ncbi:MAG: hypothetical protein OM95_00555 [Bdellovibrio sp. ArHS]|uniref:hypothetical protein n=1 Tax=Bdellovibrio sp. ArHS TaxID=1569284 RepID=UPI000582F91E|nr:hypothetical protein [Bdellovibrio sp. ArHS]KHD90045.1 MAG: hypothetical protein OM95_00555 [Bdellovibrio sp. ArHS]
MASLRTLLSLFFLITTSMAHAKVWQAVNAWDEHYESLYSEWVQENYKYNIFSNPSSPWYGIATDCADAVYAVRIIFAYENALPVAFTNIENMRPTLTNTMSNWDHLPEKQRLRAFINQVSYLTSTKTLGYDTYPIKIDRTIFRPGVIFLNPALTREEENIVGTRGGHAEIVTEIEENGYIRTLYSTTPMKVRDLITTRNPYSWPLSRLGGYRAWKTAAPKPFISNEQFSMADWRENVAPTRKQIYQWHESIRKILRVRPPTVDERIDVVVESICNLWQGRVLAVSAAWDSIQNNGGRCLSASLMDEHSTHKRDARLREAYGQLNDLTYWKKQNYPADENTDGSIRDAKEVLRRCQVITGVANTDAWELFLKMIDGHLSPDAAWHPAVRWGETSPQRGVRCR